MWWKTAKPGDKIVCIESSDRTCSPPPYVFVDEVYTIDFIYIAANDIPMVQLVETPLYEDDEFYEGWKCQSFRPVQRHNRSTETGMQIIRDIAARKREPEGV